MSASIDYAHAAMVIDEALKSLGSARVGVVIARGGRILAVGHKDERIKLHAEQVALAKAAERGVDVTGAVVYATLEPCANSRTGRVSCAELLSRAGIAVVHIGTYDPNP